MRDLPARGSNKATFLMVVGGFVTIGLLMKLVRRHREVCLRNDLKALPPAKFFDKYDFATRKYKFNCD